MENHGKSPSLMGKSTINDYKITRGYVFSRGFVAATSVFRSTPGPQARQLSSCSLSSLAMGRRPWKKGGLPYLQGTWALADRGVGRLFSSQIANSGSIMMKFADGKIYCIIVLYMQKQCVCGALAPRFVHDLWPIDSELPLRPLAPTLDCTSCCICFILLTYTPYTQYNYIYISIYKYMIIYVYEGEREREIYIYIYQSIQAYK